MQRQSGYKQRNSPTVTDTTSQRYMNRFSLIDSEDFHFKKRLTKLKRSRNERRVKLKTRGRRGSFQGAESHSWSQTCRRSCDKGLQIRDCGGSQCVRSTASLRTVAAHHTDTQYSLYYHELMILFWKHLSNCAVLLLEIHRRLQLLPAPACPAAFRDTFSL